MFRVGLRPWFMWFLLVSFFDYQFIMRLYPGLVMHDIMEKFHIDATAFGFLSSMYYFGYAGMQIPMAMLLDRFGPRLVASLFALTCSIATLLFVYTDSWLTVLLARFFIGVGSAVGFVGTSKIISMAFPLNRYAQMVGLSFTFGLLGALYGGGPTSALVSAFGFEKVGQGLFAVGCVLAALIFLFVRVAPTDPSAPKTNVAAQLKTIFTMPRLLVLAIANLLMVGALEGFADVWGVTYLMKVYALAKGDAAQVTSFIFVGMLFGGPFLATLAEKFKAYYEVAAGCGVLMAALFIVMLLSHGGLSYSMLCGLMLVTGILCCYQVIVFGIGSSAVSFAMIGITVAFLNCVNMFGGSFFHLMIGSLLDYFWAGEVDGALRVYTAADYQAALFAIPVASLLGAVLVLASRPRRSSVRDRELQPS